MSVLARKLGCDLIWLMLAALAVSIPWLAVAIKTLLWERLP